MIRQALAPVAKVRKDFRSMIDQVDLENRTFQKNLNLVHSKKVDLKRSTKNMFYGQETQI